MLQLDAKLREHVPGLSETCASERSRISQALLSEPSPDGETFVGTQGQVESYKNTQKKKTLYAAGLSAAVALLVMAAVFLRPGRDGERETVATLPPRQPVLVEAPISELAASSPEEPGLPSELQRLTEQVVPSGVREVLGPAFVPIRETYAVGRDKLLDDLGSLPIRPLTDFSRRLYSVHGVPESGERTPEAPTERDDEGLLSRWLDPELLPINWLNPEGP